MYLFGHAHSDTMASEEYATIRSKFHLFEAGRDLRGYQVLKGGLSAV